MFRVIDKAMNGFLTVLGLVLIAMVMLSVWNVVSRYVFNAAILWADEIAVFAMIVLAWLGAIVCAWRDFVVRMDILVSALPRATRRVMALLQLVLVGGICIWTAWLSWGYVARLVRFGMTSDAAGIPLWLVHGSITLSLIAMALIALLRLARLIFHGRDDLWQTYTTSGDDP